MEKTIYLQEPGINITAAQVEIGRHAYAPGEIQSAIVEARKPNVALRTIVIILGFLLLAYFSFQNILGVLLLLIILAPSIFFIFRPRSLYTLTIHTANGESRPAVSENRQDLERIQSAIDQLLAETRETPDPTKSPASASITPAGTEGQFQPTLPQNCPKCNQALTLQTALWPQPNRAQCPKCQTGLEITYRKT